MPPTILDTARGLASAIAAGGRTIGQGIRAALPFSGAYQGSPNIPPIDWSREGPVPIPATGAPFVPGFSDYTFRASTAPLAFEGFTLDRLRSAAAQHRQGLFLESSLAMFALLGFGPCLAALRQRCAPSISLDRHIVSEGARGLARVVADEVREMITPGNGLLPSPYFPPEEYGTIAIYGAMFNFSVLQHVDGEPDPETGIRMRYTRTWPVWATNYYRGGRKWIAVTTDGPVEIDGTHFSIVADEDEPHLSSAVLSLMEEVFSGRQTEQFRNAWIRAFGSPKLIGTMPPKVPTESDTGRAFYSAVMTILGPGGFGILPYEAKMDTIGLKGEASGAFKEALDSVIGIIGMVLIGSNGLLDKGTGGVYVSPAFEGVAMRLISRDIVARDRAINAGHILPFLRQNYGAQIDAAKAGGRWVDPVLRTPLPDLSAEARHEAAAKQQAAYYAAIKFEKEVGGEMTDDRAKALAKLHGADPLTLAAKPVGAASYAYDQENGIITIDQRLEELGKPPAEDDRGSLTVPAYRAKLAAEDDRAKASAKGDAEIKVADDAPPSAAATTEPAPVGASPSEES